jgi:uncharacterized small protein (DUF1192 family)
MLERLEWEGALAGEFCPMCKCQKKHGHSSGCELAALLKSGEGGMNAGNGRSELCDYEHEMSIMAQLDEAEKTIEALQQENERLKAQTAQTRYALTEIFALLEEHEPSWYLRKHYNLIGQALSATPTTYHNPADVTALKAAREALLLYIGDADEVRVALDKIAEAGE